MKQYINTLTDNSKPDFKDVHEEFYDSSIDIHEDKIDMKSNIGDDPYTFEDLRPNMHIQSDSGNNGASYNIDQNKLKYNLKSKMNCDNKLVITKNKQPELDMKKQHPLVCNAKDENIIILEYDLIAQENLKDDEITNQICDNNIKNDQIKNQPDNALDEEILVVKDDSNKDNDSKNHPVNEIKEELIVLEDDNDETANNLVGISVEEAIKFFS